MVDQMAVGAAARAIAPNAWAILERCTPGSATHREIEPEVIRSVELAKAAIEAYEAAKWRPIEEAEESVIVAWVPRYTTRKTIILHRKWNWGADGWEVENAWFSIDSPTVEGAMFRTIDPPSPVSTSPAAEDAS